MDKRVDGAKTQAVLFLRSPCSGFCSSCSVLCSPSRIVAYVERMLNVNQHIQATMTVETDTHMLIAIS